jgi:hypothetical protein
MENQWIFPFIEDKSVIAVDCGVLVIDVVLCNGPMYYSKHGISVFPVH